MTVTYVDPSGQPTAPIEPYTLGVDTAKRPLRLALIANTFPDIPRFVDCLQKALQPLLPGATLKVWQKPSVEPVTPKVLEEIAAQSDAVVAALGH
jgi:hypothetical protein